MGHVAAYTILDEIQLSEFQSDNFPAIAGSRSGTDQRSIYTPFFLFSELKASYLYRAILSISYIYFFHVQTIANGLRKRSVRLLLFEKIRVSGN